MSIKTPADLVEQFKKSGQFDALRQQLLADFKSSPALDGLTARVDEIARDRLSTDSKLQFMSAPDVQRELLSELDRYPVLSRAASDSQSLADPALISRVRDGIIDILKADRGGELSLEEGPAPKFDENTGLSHETTHQPPHVTTSPPTGEQEAVNSPDDNPPVIPENQDAPRSSDMPTAVRVPSNLPLPPLAAGLPPRPAPYRSPTPPRSSERPKRTGGIRYDPRRSDVWIPEGRGRQRSRDRYRQESHSRDWRSPSRDHLRDSRSPGSRSPDYYRSRRRSSSQSSYRRDSRSSSRPRSRSSTRSRSYSRSRSGSRSAASLERRSSSSERGRSELPNPGTNNEEKRDSENTGGLIASVGDQVEKSPKDVVMN